MVSFSIDKKVIYVDDYHHGLTHKETGIQLGGYQTLFLKVTGEVVEEIAWGLTLAISRLSQLEH